MTSLDTLVASRPELAPAAALLRALLLGMGDVRVVLPDGVPSTDAARIRLDAGVPALEGEPLIDAATLLSAAHTIARRLADPGGSDAGIRAMPALAQALSGPDGDTFTHGALSAGWDDIADAIASGAPDVDEQTLVTLLDYASRPTLRAAAAVVREIIEAARWTRGNCPGCGAPPVLAELRAPSSGGERERFLRCGRCASAWLYPRLGCPGCGTIDHRSLRYLHAEGEEEFRRAMTCDGCQGYVKEIAVLDPLGAEALLEEDLATVGLDLIALEREYVRAHPSSH